MSDKSFTFFEFHFHDAFQIGPKTLPQFGDDADHPAVTEETEAPVESPEPETTEDGSGGSGVGPILVGLGVLAAAAYAIRKLLNGGPSGLDALDDIEELEDIAEPPEVEAEEAEEEEEDSGVAIEVTSGEEPESGGNTGLLVAGVVALLLLVAIAAKKLLGGSIEEIEVPDELAEE